MAIHDTINYCSSPPQHLVLNPSPLHFKVIIQICPSSQILHPGSPIYLLINNKHKEQNEEKCDGKKIKYIKRAWICL